MPKIRGNKTLQANVTRKGFAKKQQLVETIHSFLDQYKHVLVLGLGNARNVFMKNIRDDLHGTCRLFMGKNRVMQVALGRAKEEEYKKGTARAGEFLRGSCCLCLTNKPKDEIFKYFNEFIRQDFPKAGFIATETVVLPAGPLSKEIFAVSMEAYLRLKLAMPTEVKDAGVSLVRDFEVCHKGKPLTPEQAKILKLLGNKMHTFRVAIRCYLDTETGEFETFDTTEIEGKIDEDALEEKDDDEMDEEQPEKTAPQIKDKKPSTGKARVEARKKNKAKPY